MTAQKEFSMDNSDRIPSEDNVDPQEAITRIYQAQYKKDLFKDVASFLRLSASRDAKDKPDLELETLDAAIEAASTGNDEAQFVLGVTLYYGETRHRVPVRAIEHYLKCMLEGRSTVSERSTDVASLATAVTHLEDSAKQGYVHAEFFLHEHYLLERLLLEQRSHALCKGAAEKGFAPAQHQMALAYEYGTKVVNKNASLAFGWCTKAAAQDWFYTAQHKLAEYYEDGVGVKPDAQAAGRMFALAKKHGYVQTSHFR
jgi:TPR repeat protein